MPMRVYISGPMTGMPELNFPAFHEAAKRWRDGGAEVVSPAELNPDPNAEWLDCMRCDIRALVDCDAIFMLHGWENSKGANVEKYIAEALKMDVYFQANGFPSQQEASECLSLT